MSIETTLGALVEAEPALGRLLALKLPTKTAYHLAKLAKLVREETQHFHTQREALIRELGTERDPTEAEKVQNGNGTKVISVTPEHWPECQTRLAELAAVQVTIALTPIAIDELGAIDVAGEDLLALGPLLTETREPV